MIGGICFLWYVFWNYWHIPIQMVMQFKVLKTAKHNVWTNWLKIQLTFQFDYHQIIAMYLIRCKLLIWNFFVGTLYIAFLTFGNWLFRIVVAFHGNYFTFKTVATFYISTLFCGKSNIFSLFKFALQGSLLDFNSLSI